MPLIYTYGGVVENIKDPLKLGRLKVRVPHVYGTTGGGSGFVATNDLPWAMPAGMPAGGSMRSGGFSHLPDVGDKVWVRFLDGEPEKPIWEWGMQSMDDADTLKLHSYKPNADGSVGKPDRTGWMRYGHLVELNEGGVIVSTSGGYRLLLNDSTTPGSMDGSIKVSTPLGTTFELDDLTSAAMLTSLGDVSFQIAEGFLSQSFDYSWITTGDYSVEVGGSYTTTAAEGIGFTTATDFSIDALAGIDLSAATNIKLTAGESISLLAPMLYLGGNLTAPSIFSIEAGTSMNFVAPELYLGLGATEPLVLGNQLTTFLTSLMTYLSTHTHTSGVVGSPTTAPVVPSESVLADQVPNIVSTSVYTQ